MRQDVRVVDEDVVEGIKGANGHCCRPLSCACL